MPRRCSDRVLTLAKAGQDSTKARSTKSLPGDASHSASLPQPVNDSEDFQGCVYDVLVWEVQLRYSGNSLSEALKNHSDDRCPRLSTTTASVVQVEVSFTCKSELWCKFLN